MGSVTIVVPGRFDSLGELCDFVTQAAQDAGLSEPDVHAVQVALDEACTNIIEHAYGDDLEGDIECTCRIGACELAVTLRDQGRPFDPTAVPEPNITADLDERQGGGLGVYLMRKLMDEVRFETTPETGNVLTMVKRRKVCRGPKSAADRPGLATAS